MEGLLGNYKLFISEFLENKYITKFFTDDIQNKNSLIVRHDIDFDINLARKIAIIEHELGIASTFFFLLRSPFYNVLEKHNLQSIRLIKDLGHEISIHFDSTNYDDIESGVYYELSLFDELFKIQPKIISIHRPDKIFIDNKINIKGVSHTYEPKFFRDIKYIADSRGSFRYGHPFETKEYINHQSIHLCIHPIWWMKESYESPIDLIESYLNDKSDSLKEAMKSNFIPYKEDKE